MPKYRDQAGSLKPDFRKRPANPCWPDRVGRTLTPNLTRFPLVFCTLEGLEDVIREFKEKMESYIKEHHMDMPQWIFG